jgi:acetylornithine deacetylase/succinyl-diaminopimelate desuccinylase-like protein
MPTCQWSCRRVARARPPAWHQHAAAAGPAGALRQRSQQEDSMPVSDVLSRSRRYHLWGLEQARNQSHLRRYGHLDVQPAKKEDGWHTDPFVLTNKEGKLYGMVAVTQVVVSARHCIRYTPACTCSCSHACQYVLSVSGRGSTDDKAPVLAWLWVVESYRALNLPLPVNIKLMLEGMEESGSVGLEVRGLIRSHVCC